MTVQERAKFIVEKAYSDHEKDGLSVSWEKAKNLALQRVKDAKDIFKTAYHNELMKEIEKL